MGGSIGVVMVVLEILAASVLISRDPFEIVVI